MAASSTRYRTARSAPTPASLDKREALAGACTADYPSVETVVPLGSGFEPGEEYEVRVNGEATSFVAQ